MAQRDREITEINIRPGVGMLSIFPHVNYRAWYALAEFVDNSLQSYLLNRARLRRADGSTYKLRVVIRVEPEDRGQITIWDNAAGIALKDYRRAFIAAEPPPDRSGLAQFGMGLKSAACWFAKRFEIRSAALGEGVERKVYFDVPRITRERTETIHPTVKPVNKEDHYTELRLWDLNKLPEGRTIGKMKDHLRSIYRVFLRAGTLQLEFNGEDLRFEEPEILLAPRFEDLKSKAVRWQKKIEFELDHKRRVAGFAAIRQRGSTAKAGFALFRHGRLIQGSEEDAYRPSEIFGASNSFRYQRLFGELQLFGFDVSYTKDGFLWGDVEAKFLEKLRREIDAGPLRLIQQAENHRAHPSVSDLKAGAEKAATSTISAVAQVGPVVTGQKKGKPDAEDPPEKDQPGVSATRKQVDVAVAGSTWRIALDLSADESRTEWLAISDSGASAEKKGHMIRSIGMTVSLLHPFMQRFGTPSARQMEPLLRIAAAMAIAEITARDEGVRLAGTIRRNLNELLRASLSGPSNFVDTE